MSYAHRQLKASLLGVLNSVISDRGKGKKAGVDGYQSPRTVRAFEFLAEALATVVEERECEQELEKMILTEAGR